MTATNTKEKSGATKTDVAKTYKVTNRTVDNWMREGWLPYLKIGGKIVRFNLDDVDRAIARKFGRNGGAA